MKVPYCKVLLFLFVVSIVGPVSVLRAQFVPLKDTLSLSAKRMIQELMVHQRISEAEALKQVQNYLQNPGSGVAGNSASAKKKRSGNQVQASCSNLDFSTGTTANWTMTGDYQVVSAGVDTFGGFPVAAPGSSYSLRLGNPYPRVAPYPPAFSVTSSATQTFIVSAAYPVILLQYAMVILEFGHSPSDAANVHIEMIDSAGNSVIPCSLDSAFDAAGGPPGFLPTPIYGYQNDPSPPYIQYPVTYYPWHTVNIDLSKYVGKAITFNVVNEWCRYNYDWAYCYISATCMPPNKITQADTVCTAKFSNLCAPNGMKHYQWSGPAGSGVTGDTTQCIQVDIKGSYQVICTNNGGCLYTYVYNFSQSVVNPIAAFVGPSSMCLGTAQFTDSSKGGVTKWAWDFGDAGVSNLQSPSHNYIKPGVYNVKLVVSTSGGCSDSITKQILVEDLVAGFSVMPVCSGTQVVINDTTRPKGLTPHYFYGDAASDTSGKHIYKAGGVYSVKLLVIGPGCKDSVTQNLTIYQTPVAAFSANPSSVTVLDPTVQFNNFSQNYSNWVWNFGDMSSQDSVNRNPFHVFPSEAPGHYEVMLRVSNTMGCFATDSMLIDVNQGYTFYIPSAFTPDGDGRNDGFIGSGIGIQTFQMLIFDRWGNMIYQTTDLNSPWNGRKNNNTGSVLDQDVYVWLVKTKDVNNQEHQYNGSVTLIK